MKRLLTSIAVLAAFAGLLLATGAVARVTELGAAAQRLPASCPGVPQDPQSCQAIARVTGFQVQQGEVRNPFRVRRPGKIVAFSITLSKPSARETDFFTERFGGAPQARVSVLRPGTKRRHRLTGQSEVFDLAPYLGSTPTFALDRPLTVKKDYVVALTVPTWAPAFAVRQANDEAWRSSRDPEQCDAVEQQAAQEERGSLRTYGCLYRTARLLYTATFVPDPRVTNPTAEDRRDEPRRRD